jgi:para-nitrobenzyl esterase
VLDRLAPTSEGSAAYRSSQPGATPAALHELVMSDWLMRMPSLRLAEAHHVGGGRAWAYELVWGYGPKGASHGLDALLVFGTMHHGDEVRREATRANAVEEADRLSQRMRTDWLTFATTGDPGWDRYDDRARLTRVYDAEPTTRPYPEESSRRIWHEYRFDTLDLPG